MKRCLQCDTNFESASWQCPRCGYAPEQQGGILCFAPRLAATEIGYDPGRFEVLARAERNHFWFRSRTRLIAWALASHFPDATSLLEIGCGTGNVLASLSETMPGMRMVGSEVHLAGLELAAQRVRRAQIVQMDARDVPFRAEFDVVCAFDVIEHVDDDVGVLKQLHAACNPGGGIIVTVPQHRWLWSYKDEFAFHKRRYSRRQLLAALESAGFGNGWTTSFVSLLLPLMAVSRLSQKTPEKFDASKELEIGRLANAAMGCAMAVESTMIRAGVSFPAGGSLLAIAHKPLKQR
jgi:SAM-dependent methyltransferase